ncbi:MAG: T9SS type A sorting domain-containing protein, partial [Candidatus Cloacimonetes bacterium]|nr:T9SS type A sorting domain-containing protein [Candidatus Cloacimonadota bacterium]
TFNFYPGVGYYDIMDSGGFGRVGIDVTDDNNNITRYFIEGGLPALPGAWSRIVAWEDDFRSRGILKDITEIEFDVDIFLQPAENIFTPDSDLPIFLKIPLSDKEYLLIENRQVDPDGDGGTYLHDSADGRVILYPIPVSDDPSDTTATYEYDFLLPGWFDQFGAALGGGFLIWHIDEAIIFDEGNYENNTVNSDYYHRGVKIIEADGLPDIGNPFSWFWRGTEYEPYFKYRPLLEESDAGIFFAGWDIPGTGGSDPPATHNDSLAANTNPPLITNAGNPSLFAVYDISSYPIGIDQERTMSLRVGTQIFDNTTLITVYDSLCALSSPGSTGFFSNSTLDFVTFSPGGIDIHYHIYNEEDDLWFSYNPVDDLLCPQLPVLSADMNNDNRDEYLIPCDNNAVAILENNNFVFEVEYREFASPLSEPPLYIEEYSLLVVPTQDKIFIDQDSLALANARVIYNGSDLVISSEDKILFYSLPDLSLIELHDIPELASQITPVAYKDLNPIHDAVYCQNESGDIIRITDHAPTTIFHNKAYGGEPLSQLAFARFSPDNYTCLIFAAGQRVFALSLDGSLVPGFPVHLDNKQVKPASYPRVLQIRNDTLILFEDIDGSYLAVDSEGEYRPEYSMFWNQDQTSNVFVWESDIQRLYFIFAENNSNLIASYINGVEEDPIIWNGYRNNRYSLFEGEVVPQSISGNMQAYGYPNPARHGSIRIRVINAEDNINYKIFDIAGNIVKQGNCIREPQVFQDIIWNTGNISSGMYFAVIRSGNDIKRVPLAVQN